MATAQDLLQIVNAGNIDDSRVLCQQKGWDHVQFVGIMNSLVSKEMLVNKKSESSVFQLTDEGSQVVEKGSPEFLLYNSVPEDGISKGDLVKLHGDEVVKIGTANCMRNKWLKMDKPTGLFKRSAENVSDKVQSDLKNLDSLNPKDLQNYQKRKLVQKGNVVHFAIEKGPKFSLEVKTYATNITADMIASGSWESLDFKSLNIGKDVRGIPPAGGHIHTLWKVRTMMKEIFIEMGFQEMPTNNYVESSFWNFDVLFQPQQHPARDAHDTFFVSDPATASGFPPEYLQRVKDMHENGGSGSIGWRYNWSEAEAAKNIFRTHTTAVSSRMLYKLAQEKEFKPVKYFSIDRVFRNESLDATHLAEFNQVEGLVADYNLTLGNLMGVIRQFFFKLGITDIKFKPAYNPYTEPSMEIFSWHEGTQKWLEIGNSGMFRPEMLAPMGFPPNVRVIAWGLSLERPTMIKYNHKKIRSLVGHKVKVAQVQSNPICMRGL